MKKVFIYYSLSGNGDLVADYLKGKKYDIEKIVASDKLPKNRFLQIFIGGFRAMKNYKSKIEDLKIDLSKYNEVVIGSPVWNDRLSTPINGFLDKFDLNNKKLKFILYSGSGTAKKATATILKMYPDASIIIIKEPLNHIRELEKIEY